MDFDGSREKLQKFVKWRFPEKVSVQHGAHKRFHITFPSKQGELFFRSHIHVHVHAAVVVVNAPALAPLLKDPLVLCKKIRKRGSS